MPLRMVNKRTGEVVNQGDEKFSTLYDRYNNNAQNGSASPAQGVGSQYQYQPVDKNYVKSLAALYGTLAPVNSSAAYNVLGDIIDYANPTSQQERALAFEESQRQAAMDQYALQQAQMDTERSLLENSIYAQLGGLDPYQAYQIEEKNREAAIEEDKRQTLGAAIEQVTRDPASFTNSYTSLMQDGYADEAKILAQTFVPSSTDLQKTLNASGGVVPRTKFMGIF